MKPQGKTALVTGSDSGIGQAIAATFACEGARVLVHYDTDEQGARTTKGQIEAQGGQAEVAQADLSDPAQAQRLFQPAVEALGRVDILVNDAGTGSQVSALEDPEQAKQATGQIPMGRPGQPQEVANIALLLASDDASYVTGSTYFVDGGLMQHIGGA